LQQADSKRKRRIAAFRMNETYAKARRHLSRRCAIMKRLVARIGKCTLQPNPDSFGLLARSIISQQISTRAALAIHTRLCAFVGMPIRPGAILKASDTELRGVGISLGKTLSLRDLAERCVSGEIRLKHLADHDDEEVIAQLTPVRGIGRWTAEMFLIFGLGRLDVLPVTDFGLRSGMKREHSLPDLPNRATLLELTTSWAPYRSIGTWYIWRSFGDVPQSSK
jgi:DNA-3-methyladenine glycosylase II